MKNSDFCDRKSHPSFYRNVVCHAQIRPATLHAFPPACDSHDFAPLWMRKANGGSPHSPPKRRKRCKDRRVCQKSDRQAVLQWRHFASTRLRLFGACLLGLRPKRRLRPPRQRRSSPSRAGSEHKGTSSGRYRCFQGIMVQLPHRHLHRPWPIRPQPQASHSCTHRLSQPCLLERTLRDWQARHRTLKNISCGNDDRRGLAMPKDNAARFPFRCYQHESLLAQQPFINYSLSYNKYFSR